MNPTRVYAIVLRQLYLIRGNPTRFFQIFVWILLDIVFWGFTTKYLHGIAGEFNFLSVFLGAILLEDFLVRTQQGVTVAFFEDVWARNFLNVFGSPIKVLEYVGGLVLTSIITTSVALLAMLLLASLVFGFSIFSYGIYLIPFLLILFIFGLALGVFGAAVVLRFGPASEWFIWPLPAVLAPFVGVVYPISVLPGWMQYISHALPPTYVFEGMRSIVTTGTFEAQTLIFSFGLALLYIALACWFFYYIYRIAVRTGLIARYSAETLT